MDKFIEAIKSFFKRFTLRQPSSNAMTIALSGNAVMVWTPTGNIVITTTLARRIAQRLDYLADVAEAYDGHHAGL